MPLIRDEHFPHFHFTTSKCEGDMKDEALRLEVLQNERINPADLILAKQIHSNNIAIVSKEDGGKIIDNCDGLISDASDLFLGIFTADCMPIVMKSVLKSEMRSLKAAIHCGWRGLADGIIENAASILKKEFKTCLQDIDVYIAPHIQVCCYETSLEFEEIFKTKLDGGKFDMSKIAREKMLRLGFKNITVSPLCSKHRQDLCFSYRRDKSAARMLSII